MANKGVVFVGDFDPNDLPPGFRFHPSDEELITHYLSPKVVDNNFIARAIGEVDLNKCEPWELPRKAKMGEKEWYFFCLRDRKYPTGLRTNRATEEGYWKATGKDREIFKGKALVGMKKTLVFYKGRAPKGEKSDWVMHEYRLEGKTSLQNLPSNARNEWVICRVFQKNAAGKKISYPGLIRSEQPYHENLPPLMDSSPYNTNNNTTYATPHVPCFSNPMQTQTQTQTHPLPLPLPHPANNNLEESDLDSFITSYPPRPSSISIPENNYFNTGVSPYQIMGENFMSEQHILKAILKNHGAEMKKHMKIEAPNYSASQDTCVSGDVNNNHNAEISSVVSNYDMGSKPFDLHDAPSSSGGHPSWDDIWNNYGING